MKDYHLQSTHIKKLISGLGIPQEYCCVDGISFQGRPSIWMTGDENELIHVSDRHLFLGYKPLIIGLVFRKGDQSFHFVKSHHKISLYLRQDLVNKTLATLVVELVNEKQLDNETSILIYTGVHAAHKFLNPFYKLTNSIKERLKKQSPGNVSLPGNLADQVRVAYAIPRTISVITVSDGSQVNLFPTDLHGSIGDQWYASSLRIGGLAARQVGTFKKLVISTVSSSRYREIYELGKNHMRELQPENSFDVHALRSAQFNFPLPEGAVGYRELEVVDSMDDGIHRIYFYKVISNALVQGDGSQLAHIHQYYMQWREDAGIDTPWFQR